MEFARRITLKPTRFVLHVFRQTRSTCSLSQDLFCPTAGRWLWDEPRKQQDHTRKFDLKALEHVIIKAAGPNIGTSTFQIKKLTEGASNKVFLAVVGEQRLIVKIPDPVVPPRLATASEVATLEFLRSELGLPVPKVFSWSDSNDNPVGCEYIIMEEAQGRPLNTVWSALEIDEKFAVVDEVLSTQKRLLATKHLFSGHGSLYFLDDATRLGFPKHFPVSSTSSTQSYCIGPLAHEHFVEPPLAASSVDGGPWCTAQDYLISIARSSIVRLKMHQSKDRTADRAFSFPTNTASNTSIVAICDMLETLCVAVPYIIPHSSDQRQPLLWHKDLHFGNLFVSPEGKITCIVDWQGTDILPLFLALRIPQFLDAGSDSPLLLELPDDFSEMPEAKRIAVWERYRQSMLQKYYLSDLWESAPDLAALLGDKHLAPIRKQMELFARISSRQDVDALFLRETLLRIQRHWPDFVGDGDGDVAVQSPIKIEGEELSNHQKDGRRYNEFQDLLKARHIPVADEGWVPADEFAEQKNNLEAVIQGTMEALETAEERLQFQDRLRHWNLTGRKTP